VIKHVVGGAFTASNFIISVGSSSFPGSEAGTTVTVNAGNYAVTENSPLIGNYIASFSSDCKGTIASGQTKTCVITNKFVCKKKAGGDDGKGGNGNDEQEKDDGKGSSFIGLSSVLASFWGGSSHKQDDNNKSDDDNGGNSPCVNAAILKVIKKIDGGPFTASNFTISVTNGSPNMFPASSKGTLVYLVPGNYAVTENSVLMALYTANYSADCKGSIQNGQSKTCVITNKFICSAKNGDSEENHQFQGQENHNFGNSKGCNEVLDVNMKVTNDEDSGFVGYWALDKYSKHIQIWQTSNDAFFAFVNYDGTFQTFNGAKSPMNGITETKDATGDMKGGYIATFNGVFNSNAAYPTHGFIGAFDFGGTKNDILKGTYGAGQVGDTNPFSYLSAYFSSYSNFNQPKWGWTYTYKNQVWRNFYNGSSGDIVT